MDKIYAKLRSARISSQKVRLVSNRLKGLSVGRALEILEFNRKKASFLLKKILHSVMANAEHNKGLDIDDLYVTNILVDQGTTLKRSMARCRGRMDRILKRTSHITIIIEEKR